MPSNLIGATIDELDTPALLLDLDALDHNIALMAAHITERGKHWRPHAKAFKTPAIAHMLIRAGAIGLTVAKVSEAEVFADCGIRDILIAHMVVGPSKASRLAALQRRADVKATVDHPCQLAWLAHAANAAGVSIGLLVDVDIGLERSGVRSIPEAVELARRVAQTPGLRFEGLMGYEGHALYIQDQAEKRQIVARAIDRLNQARSAVESASLTCPIVSAAGSGSYQITSDLAGVTELQAGGGIFACRYYLDLCRVVGHKTAIAVLASVVSRPTATRVVLDAGLKCLSDFRAAPRLPAFPKARVLSLSAEHGTLEFEADNPLNIGAKIDITPGYSDLTFVLHDRAIGHRERRIEAIWPLWARGKLE